MEHEKNKMPAGGNDKADAGASDLIEAARSGDGNAVNQLVEMIYPELRRRAHWMMMREREGHTFGATGSELVQRAMERLVIGEGRVFSNINTEEDLLTILTRRMRDILVDYARASGAAKRFGPKQRRDLEDVQIFVKADSIDVETVLAVREALEKLKQVNPQGAQALELRAFGGFTIEQAARIMGMDVPAFRRRYDSARVYLRRILGGK